MRINASSANQPVWREVNIGSVVPAGLTKLLELSKNLWWVWNEEAQDLFRAIDNDKFVACGENPILFLQKISFNKLEEVEKDANFLAQLEKVYADFKKYMDEKPSANKPTVAYFSMEYGLTDILKIYSGGLGVLAGDYLKEASDSNVDMVAIGFLYSYGYFTQALSMDGDQIAVYDKQQFHSLPIEQVFDKEGNAMQVEVPYPDRIVYANLWRVNVGRVSLYLLDTENEKNSEADRFITHQLYGGDWENRIKQEIMLGIGGILALNKLGIKKEVYHCNEGHAAFINIQRMCDLMASTNLTFNQAKEVIRASSLYTTHTPVPAGHDSFDEGLFYKYMNKYPEQMKISWDDLMDMGRYNPGNKEEKFSMSVFACNMSQEVNGVSWLHGRVSQYMFEGIWKGLFPEESHVGYVTNGVHMPTWATLEWKKLYNKSFNEKFMSDQSNEKIWEDIYKVPDEEIWAIKSQLKKKLIEYIRINFKENWLKNQGNPAQVVSILEKINPNALTIGFGRRFATYKRAHLLFTDLARLEKIVNNTDRPIQFIFTGKAHPADGGGKGLIKRIIEISRMPQFVGKVLFLENYDMKLAKRLISGVDIWLNTPTRPLEASGTSGEKALMNGTLNFSVLDGWWYEGYRKEAGWALTEKRTYADQGYQDQLDAATIYSMLENEIIPLYYAKNTKGFSPEWVQYIKNSFAQITPHYTTKRMLDDYIDRFYSKLSARSKSLNANNYAKAIEIANWKENFAENWDKIEVLSIEQEFPKNDKIGEDYKTKIVVDTKGIDANSVQMEIVITSVDENGKTVLRDTKPFELVKTEGSVLTFSASYCSKAAGQYKYSYRMLPKNADLPHRQDFCYVRWI